MDQIEINVVQTEFLQTIANGPFDVFRDVMLEENVTQLLREKLPVVSHLIPQFSGDE